MIINHLVYVWYIVISHITNFTRTWKMMWSPIVLCFPIFIRYFLNINHLVYMWYTVLSGITNFIITLNFMWFHRFLYYTANEIFINIHAINFLSSFSLPSLPHCPCLHSSLSQLFYLSPCSISRLFLNFTLACNCQWLLVERFKYKYNNFGKNICN